MPDLEKLSARKSYIVTF